MNDLERIALAYVPSRHRDAVAALWALDATLGRVVATTTEPLIGQMRLTWWHDRLTGLDEGAVPAEPVLVALRAIVQNNEITGAQLALLVEGWEQLLEPLPHDDDVLTRFAQKRGGQLFGLSATLAKSSVVAELGPGWALIDFAMHCSDPVTASRAHRLARRLFDKTAIHGPKFLRILARLAKAKASQPFEKIADAVSRWDVLIAVLR